MRMIILVHFIINILTLGNVQLLTVNNEFDINAPQEYLNEHTLQEFYDDNEIIEGLTVEQIAEYNLKYLEYKDLNLMDRYSYVENEMSMNDLVIIVGFSLLWLIAIIILKRWL
jgi:hypothetical protein